MRRLFVANRGEIARRIATTAATLGIQPVIPLLAGPAALDLLDAEAVVRAARAAGADALHPGYGFLSESPRLAEAVLEAGLLWVGPPRAAIAALGDKAAARATARSEGVPVAEGEAPDDQSDASLAACAARVGFPVVLKPVAGGGGKGIRVAAADNELGPALGAARREAARAFGDDRLLVERFVRDARHVEVQILADRHGGLVHLGERDCSLQRRRQKLLEEAPAPGLSHELARSLRTAALRLAAAVRYEGAGTCEFLVGGDGAFVFVEMNARLQVEHPVTELVLGRDLVADQLAIADGAQLEQLGLEQAAIEARLSAGGHAIEVRLNAEDPANAFLPSTGRVVAIRWPDDASAFGPAGETGLRVDAGVDEGDEVTGAFDPLLAKVIAVGPDRTAALARLRAALGATELLGVTTNLAFLRRLLDVPAVTGARARTTTIEEDPDVRAAAGSARPELLPQGAWQAAARLLVSSSPAWPWGGGWRANAPSVLRLAATVGDATLEQAVAVAAPADGAQPPLTAVAEGIAHVSVGGASVPVRLAPAPDGALAGHRPRSGSSAAGVGDSEVRSPLPGVVIAVHVQPGDQVAAGGQIATIEAMKMEHAVTAQREGRVEAVSVHTGDRVERGRVVARLAGGEEGVG